mmetsp:Transcript_35142/g.85114  ORF Transcript_35142/g.85114 Transcript_35142/m.85114 type:complete len:374 (+) Transcript_35142:1370-2491(+)
MHPLGIFVTRSSLTFTGTHGQLFTRRTRLVDSGKVLHGVDNDTSNAEVVLFNKIQRFLAAFLEVDNLFGIQKVNSRNVSVVGRRESHNVFTNSTSGSTNILKGSIHGFGTRKRITDLIESSQFQNGIGIFFQFSVQGNRSKSQVGFLVGQIHSLVDFLLNGSMKFLASQSMDSIRSTIQEGFGLFISSVDRHHVDSLCRVDIGDKVSLGGREFQLTKQRHADLGQGETAIDQFGLQVLSTFVESGTVAQFGSQVFLSLETLLQDSWSRVIQFQGSLDSNLWSIVDKGSQEIQDLVFQIGVARKVRPLTEMRPDQHDRHKGKRHGKDGVGFHKTHSCLLLAIQYCMYEKEKEDLNDVRRRSSRSERYGIGGRYE